MLERAHAVRTQADSEALIEEIRRVIEPIDVAGLSDTSRGNWYPVDGEDLLRAAHKLHASRDEVLSMLDRCGFSAPGVSPR